MEIDRGNTGYVPSTTITGNRSRDCRVWSSSKGLLRIPQEIVRLAPATSENPFTLAVAAMAAEVELSAGDHIGYVVASEATREAA